MKKNNAKSKNIPTAVAQPAQQVRKNGVDALRGCAIVMMIIFHFCFDLVYFHWAHWQMLVDPVWTTWRASIVTSFLTIAGLSLVLRANFKPAWADFWKRWAQIAGAAVLVSAGSYLMFPQTYIYFGVLHFVAVGLIITRLLLPLGCWNLIPGILCVAVGNLFASPAFDGKALNWIGLVAHKPITEDYVPLLPWIGVMLIGCALGQVWRTQHFTPLPPLVRLGEVLPRRLVGGLAFLGRWSLATYLIHQPIMLGILTGISWLTSPQQR